MTDKLSRRDVLHGSAALGAFVLAACSKTDKGAAGKVAGCTDTSALSSSDLQVRTTLAYADLSADATKACSRCAQFEPAGADACGACRILRGPINPTGTCKAFTPRPF
jgi:hypothetical protein